MDYENLERELVDNPDQVLAWAQTDQQAATPVLIDVLWRAPPDPPEILEYGRRAWTYDPRCHAANILGALRAIDAIDPMVDLLAAFRPTDEELSVEPSIFDKLLAALGAMGADGLEPLLARFYAPHSLRMELSEVLSELRVRDDRVLAALLEMLDVAPAFGSSNLFVYGDVAALPHLSRALDTCLGAPMVDLDAARDLRFAIYHLGGDLTEAQILALLDVDAALQYGR